MKKKAQFEVEPLPVLMGIIGAILGFIMAGRMGSGIIMKLLTTIITGVACYFIAWGIANK